MPVPVIAVLGIAAVAGLALMGSKKKPGGAIPSQGTTTPGGLPIDAGYLANAKLATPPPDLPPATPTAAPPLAPSNIVEGKSGRKWKVALAARSGTRRFMDVFSLTPKEFRVLRYVQDGDNKDHRIFVESPPGVDMALVRAAMVDFGVVAADTRMMIPPMSIVLKEKLAAALKAIGIDSEGNMTGTPTKEGVQLATATAGEIEKAGFPEAGALLRQYAESAMKAIPPVPVAQQAPLPSIPAELQTKINQAIQLERDPTKLRAIIDAVKLLPMSPEVSAVIQQLEALILSVAAQQEVAATLEKVQEVIDAPVVKAPEETVMASPPPAPPPPAPPPAPLSPQENAAAALNRHLNALQEKYGMPAAKGHEDTEAIKLAQAAMGTTSDGKPGPGTTLLTAKFGQSKLPLVMYWPRSATATRVLQYRKDVLALAAEARSRGLESKAAELEASAARERGQGGIVGSMPA